MDEEELKKLKEKIRDENLKEIYIKIIKILICSSIGAIIGYSYCKYSNYNYIFGILLGIACPWGYILVDYISKMLYSFLEDLYKLVSLITFGIYAIAWFLLKIVISAYVGLVTAPILVIYFMVKIKRIWKEDYTEEAKTRYNIEHPQYNIKYDLKNYKNNKDKEVNYNYPEEEYYCEMCFKKISKEEYELHECLCEDCYMNIHTDENGNFREDYYKY